MFIYNKLVVNCLFVIILGLSACESRKDIFELRNQTPALYLSKTLDFSAAQTEIYDTIRYGETLILYYHVEDDFYGDSELSYDCSDLSGSTGGANDTLRNGPANVVFFDGSDRVRIVNRNAPFVMGGLEYTDIIFTYFDYYKKVRQAKVHLTIRSNEPAIPVIELIPLTENGADPRYEYTISAKQSYDPDGDDIVAYEYLIDGKVHGLYNGYGYENFYDRVGPGQAGSDGTYVYATALTEIKHAFQTDGYHVIRVRCKDAVGLWSEWQVLEIDI